MRRIGFAIGVALLAAGCALAPDEGAEEAIVFASLRAGNTDIYLAAPDGSGLRRLTRDPAPDQFPRCSPDGRSIVFVRGEGEAAELYRLDLANRSEHRLTEDRVRDSTPGWSPDGSLIYFTKRVGPRDRIAAMNADGSGLCFLTDGAAHDTMPAVSPDGRLLVHHTYRYGRDTELQLIDLATGASRRITALSGSDYEASFAGNDHVVFSTNVDGGHYRLYMLEVAAGDVHLLADTSADAWGARHSARSDDVLFYTGTRDAWRLMRVPRSGGTPTSVLNDGFSNYGGDWCYALRRQRLPTEAQS